MDPDSELITATAVTPANTADAQPAPELINDLLNTTADTAADADTAEGTDTEGADTAADGGVVEEFAGRPTVYGDSAYGSGEFQGLLQQSRINSRCRTQPAAAPGGRFTKDRFVVDLLSGTVTCPAGATVVIRARGDGSGTAAFGAACHRCALRGRCTDAAGGRTVRIGTNEAVLAASRAPPTGPRMAKRLPRRAPQSRTQTRAPRAAKTRRPPRPSARPGQSRRRLQPAGRSRQHRAPRRARAALNT